MTEAEKHSEAYIYRIKKIYEQAYRNVNREINRVYWNYYKDTGVDIDKLKELLTRSETEKLWEQMKKQGLDRFIKNNYKSRISRLEQIQAQIYAKAKLIYPKEELEQTMCYEGVINNSYYKAVYDTQMGTGYDFAFNKIDKNLVSSILNEKWSGKNYSQRIWKNTDILAESVSQLVGGALLSGQSIQKTTREIKERFRVSKYYAERLVRTETNHFNNEADALAYEEMGVDQYVFVATLDDRTSPMCQSHDNKKYKYKDREVGVNYPPLHPNCRSTTRGYLGEEAEANLQRRARNPKTGRTELIGNISYEEWAKNNGLAPKMTVKGDNKEPNLKKDPKNGIIVVRRDMLNVFNYTDVDYDNMINDTKNGNINAKTIWNNNQEGITIEKGTGNYCSGSRVVLSSPHNVDTINRNRFKTVFHETGHSLDYLVAEKVRNKGINVYSGDNGFYADKTYDDFHFSSIFTSKKYNQKVWVNGVEKTIGMRLDDMLTQEGTNLVDNIFEELKNEAVKNGLKKSDIKKAKAYDKIREMIKEDSYGTQMYRDVSPIQDIMEGVTKGKVNSTWGHGASYWKDTRPSTEAFAHLYSAYIRNSEKEIEYIKKYFPKSIEIFEEMLEEMIKY
jgi:SPP1 gp7 family putative phage head morphogenesis protein